MQKRVIKISKAASSANMRIAKGLLCLALMCVACIHVYAQNKMNADKIAPAFKALLAKNNITTASGKKKCIFSKKNTKKPASSKAITAEKYDCIVYTKDAKALSDKGIIINSTLPTFVTAKATLQQIAYMSSLKEVTYIDAPATDVITH